MTFKILAFLFLMTTLGQAATSMVFTGTGYISQNKTWILTEENGYVSNWNNYDSWIMFSFSKTTPTEYVSWNIDIAAPKSQPLSTGIYTGAERYGFHSGIHAGFDIGGDGRGSNSSVAQFEILELEFSPINGVVSKLAVNFQHSAYSSNTFGSLRHNSSIPHIVPVPEPSTTLLGFLSLGLIARRKR